MGIWLGQFVTNGKKIKGYLFECFPTHEHKSSRGINLRLSLQKNKSMRFDVASWLPIAILHYSFCDIVLIEPLF